MGAVSPTIRVADRADPEGVRRLTEAIAAYNVAATGIDDAQDLYAVLRDDHDEVSAGVYGWSWGGTCWVELLWVREDHRQLGVGTALMRAVEATARSRGCTQIALTTHGFQAPGFYRRLGFEEVGVLEDYPRGSSDLLLRLRIRGGAPSVERHDGPRHELRALFELAEDSATELDAYIDAGCVLVARDGEEVVGHVQLIERAEPGAIEVRNIAVLPFHRRRGIGRSLMAEAITVARAASYSTLVVATAAADTENLRFYQRMGFRLRRVERDAYTRANGYPPGTMIDGIRLRDRVWLDLALDS